ncbi:MAG: hypothetical protein WBG11_14620 [Methylocella sp.]
MHHLVKSGEILGMMLLTEINLAYYEDLWPTWPRHRGGQSYRFLRRGQVGLADRRDTRQA